MCEVIRILSKSDLDCGSLNLQQMNGCIGTDSQSFFANIDVHVFNERTTQISDALGWRHMSTHTNNFYAQQFQSPIDEFHEQSKVSMETCACTGLLHTHTL